MSVPTRNPVQHRARDYRPPTIDGVGPSCVGLPTGAWATALDFLAERFPTQGRTEWARRMRTGKVLDAAGQSVDEHMPYPGQGRLFYYRDCASEAVAAVDVPIVFRNEHLLVVDKPHRLAVVPSGSTLRQSLLVRLKRELGMDGVTPIHRIDRDTAGLVMFSLQPRTRDAYHALFRQRQVHKTYEAIAPWRPELALPLIRRSRIKPGPHFLQQCEQPGTPNAETRVILLKTLGALGWYRLHPVTGQRHQLRVHMMALGLPIVGDSIYPVLSPEHAHDSGPPLQLLARSLAFTDPVTGETRQFTSQRTLALAAPNGDFSAGGPALQPR